MKLEHTDAEVVRLKATIERADAEIERLEAERDAQDREIERLKALVGGPSLVIAEVLEEQRKLITELADAVRLGKPPHHRVCPCDLCVLLRRAREAGQQKLLKLRVADGRKGRGTEADTGE